MKSKWMRYLRGIFEKDILAAYLLFVSNPSFSSSCAGVRNWNMC